MPALSSRLTTDMLPLPLGEGWGEGSFAFPAKQVDHPKTQPMTNLLIQHRFLPKHASHGAALPLKIAKRQSLSRERTMAAIVDNSRVQSSGLGAGTQGR